MSDNTELWKKYRPKRLGEMIGQPAAVKQLTSFLAKKAVPHSLLFTGPSGCGKTTAARILASELGCSDLAYREINASSDRGIDMVRDIQGSMGMAPMRGKVKMFVLDECHALQKPPQEALLKTLEDTPKHVYFILCTSDPGKLIPAVKTRCTEIKFDRISPKNLSDLIELTMGKEALVEKDPKKKVAKAAHVLKPDLKDRLIEASDGSARKCLVLLEQILQTNDEDEQEQILQAHGEKSQGWQLARCLHDPRSQWKDAVKIIKDLNEDAEGVRRVVLAWAEKAVLGGGGQAARAAKILNQFQFSFHETGRPMLTLAVFQFYHE